MSSCWSGKWVFLIIKFWSPIDRVQSSAMSVHHLKIYTLMCTVDLQDVCIYELPRSCYAQMIFFFSFGLIYKSVYILFTRHLCRNTLQDGLNIYVNIWYVFNWSWKVIYRRPSENGAVWNVALLSPYNCFYRVVWYAQRLHIFYTPFHIVKRHTHQLTRHDFFLLFVINQNTSCTDGAEGDYVVMCCSSVCLCVVWACPVEES